VSSPRPVRPDWVELPLGDHALAECPRWDVARQRLSWVDILGGTLASATRLDGVWVEVEHRAFGRVPTAAEPLPDGALAVAVDGTVCVLQPDGAVTQRVPVSPDFPAVRTNDMTVDRAGRLLVGLFAEDRVSARGGVVAVDLAAVSVTPHVQGYVTANGLAVSPDGEYLYAVDTARGTLSRHRIGNGVDAGRVLVEYGGPGVLDGIAFGPDGDVWVAVWDAGVLHRYDPDGRLLQVVTAPARRPSAVAMVPLADGVELVVTTARSQAGAGAMARPPSAGHGAGRAAFDTRPGGRLYATPLPG
jgi:sugar lactone lactonase YvrE